MAVSKVGATGGSAGALGYVLGNAAARVVEGSFFGTPEEIAEGFELWERQRPTLRANTAYLIEAYAPETKVTDELVRTRARAKLERLGFAECPSIVIRHDDKDHYEHVHVLVSRIRPDGSVVPDSHLARGAPSPSPKTSTVSSECPKLPIRHALNA